MPKDALGVLLASAARTDSANETALDLKSGTPQRGLVAKLVVTAVAGTAPTLAPTIEHSTDNTTFTTLATFDPASITAVGEAFCTFETDKRYVRLAHVIGGTSESFTMSCYLQPARP